MHTHTRYIHTFTRVNGAPENTRTDKQRLLHSVQGGSRLNEAFIGWSFQVTTLNSQCWINWLVDTSERIYSIQHFLWGEIIEVWDRDTQAAQPGSLMLCNYIESSSNACAFILKLWNPESDVIHNDVRNKKTFGPEWTLMFCITSCHHINGVNRIENDHPVCQWKALWFRYWSRCQYSC